jgi:D-arabinose 1-dehydrogenase-like Zn-dependent alcohol dehydrogenase
VAFIGGVGGVGHLAVVWAEVVVTEAAVFEAMSMHVMAEQTEANMGIFTEYLAQAKLNEFVR